MTDKYSVQVFWSEEDSGFIAIIPEFELLSAFGVTREEALANAETVLEAALSVLAEDGLPPPKPFCMPPAQAKHP